jgi:hypothetical protein
MTSKNNGYLPSSRAISWYRNITEVIDYFGMDKCKIFNLKSTLKNYIFQCLCMKYKNTWKSELFHDKRHHSCGHTRLLICLLNVQSFINADLVFDVRWETGIKKKSPICLN